MKADIKHNLAECRLMHDRIYLIIYNNSPKLTTNYHQRCKAGEGGNVQIHAMEALRKPQDRVDPVPEPCYTLFLVQHTAIAEDKFFGVWIRSVILFQTKISQYQYLHLFMTMCSIIKDMDEC